jgi:hypothetical protein
VGVGVNEGSRVAVVVDAGAVVSFGSTAGVWAEVWVAVGARELQADTMRMAMLNNVMNLILGFIFIPYFPEGSSRSSSS